MNKCVLFLVVLFLIQTSMNSQEQDLPYYEIPEAPENFNQGAIAARMIDGLGFRYYWATEGLRAADLNFKPNDDARTSEETIDHILGLSNVIVNSTLNQINQKTDDSKLSFSEKRKLTLENLKTAADNLRASNDLSQFKILFSRNDETVSYPFWNQINGPISDAIWHCGQLVLLRRSSGNPFNSKVSVFTGTVRK